MAHPMMIYVLGFGELYHGVLNAIVAFMGESTFDSLLRLTALIGIIMASAGYLKRHDPMEFGKWVLGYVLVLNVVILPKTDVAVFDISNQRTYPVANVPVIFALTANLITNVGVALTEQFEMLLSRPDDLTYTKTGSLFGSKMIRAAHDFRIMDPQLKAEMDAYLRNCVIGDIRLNHKYTLGDIGETNDIWGTVTKNPSPLRMTEVNGKPVTCLVASSADNANSLRKKLEKEIKSAYTTFGISLFGKQCVVNSKAKNQPCQTNYEALFNNHLTKAFDYFQGMTNSTSEIFLQSMMINALGDGIKDYQAFTDSTAGVVNNQVTKSQLQHRWSWAIAGQKAAWFLPILHTILTAMLFCIFPVVLVLTTLPNGLGITKGYLQFFVSLQFWPLLFAFLNFAMTLYGSSQSSQYNGITMVNIDKIDELHSDLAGVSGYLMLMIPFIAKGLVSNLSEAFSNLATSMTGHLQGSAMSVANDAASASFSLGQTSFYNSSANNLSANKHDSNWTQMSGMHTEQMGTGVLKTTTGSGDTVFDVSPGMSRSGVHISDTKALSGSLNQAFEESTQAARNESQHYQSSLSNFAHRATQLSTMQGHDMRLGDGVSSSESGQYQKALATMTHIATDVAKRLGISQEDALAHMTSVGLNAHAGVSSSRSVLGWVGKAAGFDAGIDAHGKVDRSSTSSDRLHEGSDRVVSAKEAKDFNDALSYVNQFAKNHHFDDSYSQGASLSNQLGADLRDTQTASHNYDASMAKSERISRARSYVESKSDQVVADLNQAFPGYVASRLDEHARDELFTHPGDMASVQKLQALANDFISEKRDGLIVQYGNAGKGDSVDAFYQQERDSLAAKEGELGASYKKNSESLQADGKAAGVGIDAASAAQFQQNIHSQVDTARNKTDEGGAARNEESRQRFTQVDRDIEKGKEKAQENVALPEGATTWIDHHDKKK